MASSGKMCDYNYCVTTRTLSIILMTATSALTSKITKPAEMPTIMSSHQQCMPSPGITINTQSLEFLVNT